jgi:hypothetical protein
METEERSGTSNVADAWSQYRLQSGCHNLVAATPKFEGFIVSLPFIELSFK